MKNFTYKNILLIISTYIIVSIILPILFKYLIFENTSFSNLNNSEWSSFLGSYVGGILGGLGTLISVYITVKETRNMQVQNKKDTDAKLLDDKKSRDAERKDDKAENEKKEKLKFTDGIAEYVGRYITYISKYYYSSLDDKKLCQDLDNLTTELNKCNNYIHDIGSKLELPDIDSEEFISLNIKKENLTGKKQDLERKLLQLNNDIENNRKFGERTVANECFFILNTKLRDIPDAEQLLLQLKNVHNGVAEHLDTDSFRNNWLENNTDELMNIFTQFKNSYCN